MIKAVTFDTVEKNQYRIRKWKRNEVRKRQSKSQKCEKCTTNSNAWKQYMQYDPKIVYKFLECYNFSTN